MAQEQISNPISEFNKVKYDSFDVIAGKMRELANEYTGMPVPNLVQSFMSVNGMFSPQSLNKRVKSISSTAGIYTKNQVEEMLKKVSSNELPLRQTEHALEFTSYPLFHLRTVYQNLLTYHSYFSPFLSEEADSTKPDFWREWKLLEKTRNEMNLQSIAHEITGQALQEGKVFYYPRIKIDKAHNKVNYAFMQQIPSDWVKIVGFNNKSKYTLAFNMMYFTLPATDYRQFGDLFIPYIEEFNRSLRPRPTQGRGDKIIYADKSGLMLNEIVSDNVEAYWENGSWYYWVILPIDKVFTFEIDDTNRNVVSPFTGLFLDMLQLVAYENVQLELIQNPLISVLTGEIPYFEEKGTNTSDQYKLSNAGRELFQAYWYQMLAANNTGGIGIYSAPLKNMTLHQLAEAPSAMDISGNGYSYTLSKAGLAGIVPIGGETRAGMAQISFKIESRFAEQIYACFERMFNVLIENFKLKYSWRFTMFGTLATDSDDIEESRQGMTLGILPSTMRYLALKDMSIFDDMSISTAIINSGLMEKRIPLKSTYNSTDNESGDTITTIRGGRPESGEDITSDGNEGDKDSPTDEEGDI